MSNGKNVGPNEVCPICHKKMKRCPGHRTKKPFLLVGLFAVTTIAAVFFLANSRQQRPGTTDVYVSQSELLRFNNEVCMPIIMELVQGSAEMPQPMTKLYVESAKKIAKDFNGAPLTIDPLLSHYEGQPLALMAMNVINGKPRVGVFLPRAYELYLDLGYKGKVAQEKEFRITFAIYLLHEALHHVLRHDVNASNDRVFLAQETEAWAMTMDKVIAPISASYGDCLPSPLVKACAAWLASKKDPSGKAWEDFVRNNFAVRGVSQHK